MAYSTAAPKAISGAVKAPAVSVSPSTKSKVQSMYATNIKTQQQTPVYKNKPTNPQSSYKNIAQR